MKHFFFVILSLSIFSVSQFTFAESCGEADPNIIIIITQNGNNLEVTFSDAEESPVGVSFEMVVGGATLADPNLSTIDGDFNTPIDWAFDNQDDPNNFANGSQTPVAQIGAPGVAALGSNNFSVSAGALGADTGISGAIATIVLNGPASSVALSPDCTRGGVVTENGVEMDVEFVFAPCLGICPTCPGDCNGDGITNVFDLSCFAVLLQTYGLPPFYNINYNPCDDPGDICIDLNQDNVINVFDLSQFSLLLQTNGLPPFYNVVCP